MDTETVLKVIAMLDLEIDILKKEFENPLIYGYQLDWIQGQIIGFRDFKILLLESIEAQVNQVENEQGM
jgi:hypothetical protein